MLTPDYLNLIEFNDVVKIYEKLNIEIMADIIKRVSAQNDITETSLKQLKIMQQINGDEIFNKALEETAMLTTETKKALKSLYEDVAKENIQGYKELYKYRNKPFKLTNEQYKILNQGLKQTNRILRNFTNTIAFQSKQTYVNAIDEAYMKVVTGAFDYNTAINQAVHDLAKRGITLKDKLGRNVQLEVAVRRNVLAGIQETANNINRDIEDDLGCDGYEVTAHYGARPSHARYQGLQFAVDKEDAKKYKVMWWGEEVDSEMGTEPVSELWNDYNCRHNYFGIILGISEPAYNKKELIKMKNATLTLNGKEVPYYEATQKQRKIENQIRKQDRAVQTLEKAGIDATIEKSQLTQLKKEYNQFCNETGLAKDYGRINVVNNNSTKPVKSSIIELPNYKNAIIPKEKFTKYALDPEKDKNKAEAFEKALGYNKDNADKLIENIRNNINKFDATDKGNNEYGKKYEVLMTLVGENKKVANVKTGWIIDKKTGETRLTSAYVTSKQWKKEGNK
ncbi:MAG: phage minor capsid protein [Clostridia bacterium]|nr:phage minor capsid protein [Clostridia bacterium]